MTSGALPTQLLYGEAARRMLHRSIARSVRAIALALGPDGRIVLNGREPLSDGVSIARATTDETGPNSVGARILRDTLVEAERDLCDGTARLACVAEGAIRVGLRAITTGVPSGRLADAMLRLGEVIEAAVRRQVCQPCGAADIAVCAGADPGLAVLLSELPSDVVRDGWIDLRSAADATDGIGVESGYTFDVHRYVAGLTAGEIAAELILERASVLVIDDHLDDFATFARVLEGFAGSRRSLCIIARGFGPTTRATLTTNRRGLGLKVVGLVPDDVGERAVAVLADLAVATGATMLGRHSGTSLMEVRPDALGQAVRLEIRAGKAVFRSPSGDAEAVASRRRSLLIDAERQRFLSLDREHLRRRAARLGGCWAEVRLGGASGPLHRRLRDGRAAVRALTAARDGVVPGGGVALAAVAEELVNARGPAAGEADTAARLAIAAGCRSVMRRIAASTGRATPMMRGDARRRSLAPHLPYSADGRPLADPVFTTVELLRRAVSMAATVLRVELMVSG